ncbi:MAG: SDR family oxidoreductase [Gemmatimonadales bacterium]|nr:SDR family oxidoreductase [Gemmatimonadales bacterium]
MHERAADAVQGQGVYRVGGRLGDRSRGERALRRRGREGAARRPGRDAQRRGGAFDHRGGRNGGVREGGRRRLRRGARGDEVEGAIGKPEDLAAVIAFLASDEAHFINGATLVADGGRLDIL